MNVKTMSLSEGLETAKSIWKLLPHGVAFRTVGTRGKGRRGRFFSDQLTLFQPRGKGQVLPTKLLATPLGFSDLPTALLNIDRFVASSLLTKYFGIGWCMTLTYNRCTLFNCFWVGGTKSHCSFVQIQTLSWHISLCMVLHLI